MADHPVLKVVKWVSGLAMLGLLGATGNAWADVATVDNPAAVIEAVAQPPRWPASAAYPAIAAEPDLAPGSAVGPDLPAEIAPDSPAPSPSVPVEIPAEADGSLADVTTAAADLVDLTQAGSPQPAVSPWAWSLAQSSPGEVDALDSAPLEAAAPPEAAPSPWRVEFRPYLEVPFSVNGQLMFESVAGLGDINVVFSGNSVDSLTLTANPSVSSGSLTGAGISRSELAALATATRNNPQGSAVTLAAAPRTRSVQLTQTRGVDLSSVFLLGGELEIWYNDFALALDGFYANLGSRLLFGRSGSSNSSESVLELGVDYTRIGAALGWRAGRFPLASRDNVPPEEIVPAVTVDLFGGARYSSYGFDFVSTSTQQTERVNPSWFEPTLLTRAEFLFDQRTKLTVNGYVGGFGIGNSPNFSWGGSAGIDWRFFPNVSIRPSYQFASVDWDGDEGIVSLQTHSLSLGFVFYFE